MKKSSLILASYIVLVIATIFISAFMLKKKKDKNEFTILKISDVDKNARDGTFTQNIIKIKGKCNGYVEINQADSAHFLTYEKASQIKTAGDTLIIDLQQNESENFSTFNIGVKQLNHLIIEGSSTVNIIIPSDNKVFQDVHCSLSDQASLILQPVMNGGIPYIPKMQSLTIFANNAGKVQLENLQLDSMNLQLKDISSLKTNDSKIKSITGSIDSTAKIYGDLRMFEKFMGSIK